MKLMKVTAVLLSSVFSSYGTEQLTDPYQILSKHYEAIGGLDKLKAEKTSYTEGTIVIEGTGLEGTFKEWKASPICNRQDYNLKVMKQILGDNGRFSWQVDANGKLKINKDEYTLKARKVDELLAKYEYLNPKSPYFNLTFEGIQKVGKVDCYVIKLTNNINEDVILRYYNSSSFYLEKETEIKPDGETQTLFSDYRDVNGVKHSFQQRFKDFSTEQKQTIQIKRYEVNIDIDSSLFEPPSQAVKDFHFLNGKAVENIPFQFIENHIFLTVSINNEKRLWILDSGAQETVVDTRYAQELGLKLEGSIKGQGAGNLVSVSFTTLPPFRLQGLQFDSQKVTVIDISSVIKKTLGFEIAGLLGYDFLSRLITKIDYANETISFYDPDGFRYSGNGKVIEAPLSNSNAFLVPMTIDGKYSGKWSLDLGAGGLTFLFPFAEENNLLGLPGIDRIGFGAGGGHKSRHSKFHTAELSGFVLKEPLISIPSQKGKGAFGKRGPIGNLGNSLMRHFVLLLDYKNQRIILEKGKDFGRKFPGDKSGLELLLTEDGNIEVFFVSPSTPAEKAGFQKGDIVQSINGIRINYFKGIVAIRKLLREKAGTEYTFNVSRDGKIRNYS
jgi:hypothetical protein